MSVRSPHRRDAARSRQAILDAARELLGAGSDVPVQRIARHAGVGQATIYRHFPTRADLLRELFDAELDQTARIGDEYRGRPDAFDAVLEASVAVIVRFRGLVGLLRSEGSNAEGALQRMRDLFAGPIRDATAAGYLRSDVTFDDVFTCLAMVDGAVHEITDPAERQRLATRAVILLDRGIRA